MTITPVRATTLKGRLRREYFTKGEAGKTPLPLGVGHPGRNVFTLHGHRLSSLYRKRRLPQSGLTFRLSTEKAASPFFKYSKTRPSAGNTGNSEK